MSRTFIEAVTARSADATAFVQSADAAAFVTPILPLELQHVILSRALSQGARLFGHAVCGLHDTLTASLIFVPDSPLDVIRRRIW